MKIAYLSGAFVPSRGANSVHVMRMCPALARLGHEVVLHVPRGEPSPEDDFEYYGTERSFSIVKHRRLEVRVVGALAYAATVRRYYSSAAPPDLVYAREMYSLAALVSRTGTPFCFESHWRPKNPVQQRLETWLLKHPSCRRVIFISSALRELYQTIFPWFPREKMLVAHDAADAQPSVARARDAGSRLQVAYVGSFFAGYGVDLIPELARKLPAMDFHVVGGDPAGVEAYRSRTSDVPNLRFHGFVAPSRLPELYAGFDVVVAPYQTSAPHIGWISPMKLFEYMAFGKAIVCADFPVMREILEHEVTALLVPPADVERWRAALERLSDRALRERLAAAALARFSKHHTWDERARSVLNGL